MKLFSKRKDNEEVTEQDSSNEVEETSKNAQPKKKRSKKWIVAVIILVVIGVIVALLFRSCNQMSAALAPQYTYSTIEQRDIVDTLTGSGALEPADSYTVTTFLSGDILSTNFEEGDVVYKGHVLYKIDSSDAANNIERAELSVAQSQRNYQNVAESIADLKITAPIAGEISGITVQSGDMVGTQSPVASIKSTSKLTLTEYYSNEYSGTIYTGMPATVSLPDKMLNLTGQVKEVSSQTRTSETGISCFAVTVEISNPGSLDVGTSATCWLSADGNEIYPSIVDDDGLDAYATTTVYADVTGKVSTVYVNNGEKVSAGQTIIQLTSDTLNDEVQNAADSLKDAELSLDSNYDSLDDYTITAPIDGTIIDKYYKQGEKTESGKPLCIIYDLSNLTLILDVDELDISQISVGQTASITADAVPDETYEGVITKIGINGTTVNGVTTYPVTIRIDETEGLLPGMNVDVSIVVRESKNAWSIPADAIENGNRVLVKSEDGSSDEGAPEGYKYVVVETGAYDSDFVEILSGLNEGDEIAYIPPTAVYSNSAESAGFGPPQEGEGAGPGAMS